jgi:hypothetical protein
MNCCFCFASITEDESNNPFPLCEVEPATDVWCCDVCNEAKVVPMRIATRNCKSPQEARKMALEIMKTRMTGDLKPFTRADFDAARQEREDAIERRRVDLMVRVIYNETIEKIKNTGEEYHVYKSDIHDQAVRSGTVEKKLRALFPDFEVKTDFVRYPTGPGLQHITIRW